MIDGWQMGFSRNSTQGTLRSADNRVLQAVRGQILRSAKYGSGTRSIGTTLRIKRYVRTFGFCRVFRGRGGESSTDRPCDDRGP